MSLAGQFELFADPDPDPVVTLPRVVTRPDELIKVIRRNTLSDGWAHFSRRMMADRLGCSVYSARRALRVLESRGDVRVEMDDVEGEGVTGFKIMLLKKRGRR